MARVLVTGGTGFIGRHVCRCLADAGFQVSVATRNPRAAETIPRVDVRTIPGFGPRFDWSGVLRDVQVVVHAAALTELPPGNGRDAAPGRDAEREFQRCNVDGTAKLARDAIRAGVGRLILISTAKVHGEVTPADRPLTEDAPIAPVGAYARSKADAERVLAEEAAAGQLAAVVLRPPPVYGPGMRPGNLDALLRRAIGAHILPLGGFTAPRSLIAAANLADVVRVAIDHPAASGRTYLVRDGEDVSVARLVRLAAAGAGRQPLILAVPPAMLRLAAALVGGTATIDRLAAPFCVDDQRVRRDLGWSPPLGLVRAVSETAAAIAAEVLRR